MTRIAELLDRGPTVSFEFFPPKTDEAERQLDKVLAELAPLEPDFASVTYGALGSTRDRTRDVVVRMNRELPFPTMAHLTCVGHRHADIVDLLDTYADNGVENILALGGDPPQDGPAEGDFTHAMELVEVVREHRGEFCIGVAAHPELHPRSPDRRSDREHLARKLEVADFGVTQFFFDVGHYVRMVEELAAMGCTTPIVPGVMPLISVAGVRRMAGMNGTVIPADLLERLLRIEDDPDAVVAAGIEVAIELGQGLLAAGAPGLHLYALNRSTSVKAVHAALFPPA